MMCGGLNIKLTATNQASSRSAPDPSTMTAKTVLITGCSEGGIGDALAREFHRRGHAVFATARSVGKMTRLKDMGLHTIKMDVTSPESIAKAVEIVDKASNGRLDFLVNNAGVNHVMPFADSRLEDLKAVLDTNLFGVVAVTHAFLPLLIEARGLVAGIGSINRVVNPPWQAAYNASKIALEGFLGTLRIELEPFGVRVTTIITGAVTSHLFDHTRSRTTVPEGSLYSPLKDRIESHAFLNGVKWMSADDYAKATVSELVNKHTPAVLWKGGGALILRLVNMIAWPGMLVSRACLDITSSRLP